MVLTLSSESSSRCSPEHATLHAASYNLKSSPVKIDIICRWSLGLFRSINGCGKWVWLQACSRMTATYEEGLYDKKEGMGGKDEEVELSGISDQ